MRLESIQRIKSRRAIASQPLYPAPANPLELLAGSAPAPSLKRRVSKALAPAAFPLKWLGAKWSHRHSLSDWQGLLTSGYHFSQDWVQRRFAQAAGGWADKRVLLPGTNFNTNEARQWFARPVTDLHLLDIMDWGPSFEAASAQLRDLCPAKLTFHHGTLDALPLPDESIDVIESRAVLEHVGNMGATAAETARVLAPGGVALHGFGPLYYSHGGDHCIAACGQEHGFDHLLLDEASYVKALMDENAFAQYGLEASDARYWAIQQIFSYLKPQEYLEAFAPFFDFVLVLGMVNPQAVAFRKAHPETWRRMRDQGLAEADLLIGGMSLILRKKQGVGANSR